jgi:hypothetical protein
MWQGKARKLIWIKLKPLSWVVEPAFPLNRLTNASFVHNIIHNPFGFGVKVIIQEILILSINRRSAHQIRF